MEDKITEYDYDNQVWVTGEAALLLRTIRAKQAKAWRGFIERRPENKTCRHCGHPYTLHSDEVSDVKRWGSHCIHVDEESPPCPCSEFAPLYTIKGD